jgi:hypothetical protein
MSDFANRRRAAVRPVASTVSRTGPSEAGTIEGNSSGTIDRGEP